MQLYVCAVYDKGIEAYNTPMYFRAIGEAKRSFLDACSPEKGQAMFMSHPEDYVFFCLGQFDDKTGIFQQADTGPFPVMTALEAVSIMKREDAPLTQEEHSKSPLLSTLQNGRLPRMR